MDVFPSFVSSPIDTTYVDGEVIVDSYIEDGAELESDNEVDLSDFVVPDSYCSYESSVDPDSQEADGTDGLGTVLVDSRVPSSVGRLLT
jgi:hypothetical protein